MQVYLVVVVCTLCAVLYFSQYGHRQELYYKLEYLATKEDGYTVHTESFQCSNDFEMCFKMQSLFQVHLKLNKNLFSDNYSKKRVMFNSKRRLETVDSNYTDTQTKHFVGSLCTLRRECVDASIALTQLQKNIFTGIIKIWGSGYSVNISFAPVTDIPQSTMYIKRFDFSQLGLDTILHPNRTNVPNSDGVLFVDPEYPNIFPIYDGETNANIVIEVLVVNDYARLAQFHGSSEEVFENTEMIMNQVNVMYQRGVFPGANIYVILAEQLVFSEDFLSLESDDASEIITKLNDWRNLNFESLSDHDVVHLFTGLDLEENTLGLAYLGSVCDVEVACSVLDPGYCYRDTDTGEYTQCCLRWAVGLSMIRSLESDGGLQDAHTVAHELGHNLGFGKFAELF